MPLGMEVGLILGDFVLDGEGTQPTLPKNVKAIFSEGFTETYVHWSLFSVNGFTENAEAIFYFQ